MSEYHINPSALPPPPIPPTVATSYLTNLGTAIPAANVLKVFGASTIGDNNNGISTFANPNLGNEIDIRLTNRIVVDAITSDSMGQTQTVIVYTPAFNSAAVFKVLVCGYSLFGADAVGGEQVGLYVNQNGTPFIVGNNDTLDESTPGLIAADWNVIVSGTSLAVQFVGVAGKVITWQARFEYSPAGP
jgi:hypothetical protein